MQPIEALEEEARSEIANAQATASLRELEIRYLGKSGLVSRLIFSPTR